MKQKEHTNIGWTDYTWNIAVGCTKVSEGCKFCYMMREFDEGSFKGGSRKDEDGIYIPVNGIVKRTAPSTFNKPLLLKKAKARSKDGSPLKVFVSSLTDMFHEQIDSYRDEVWAIMKQCPDFIFQILTKRPERIINNLPDDWGKEGYPNVWIGTTIENQNNLDRLVWFNMFPAKKKFVSFEPLIGEIKLHNCDFCFQVDPKFDSPDGNARPKQFAINFDWAIIGGESGNDNGKWKYRPCEINWMRSLHNDLTKAGVPVFMKQTGTYLAKRMREEEGIETNRHGTELGNLPDDFKFLLTKQFPYE